MTCPTRRGHLREVSRTSRPSRRRSPAAGAPGRELGLALRGDLTDEDVAGTDVGTDADDATLVEVAQDVLGDVRDLTGDLLGAQLGVAGVDLVLLDVDRGEDVLFDQALADDDGVLVVVALPGHEGHEEVAAQRQLAVVGGGAVGEHVAGLHLVALTHDRLLVDRRALVRALELGEREGVLAVGVLLLDDDAVAGDLHHLAVDRRDDHVAGVVGGALFHAGPDQRRLRLEQRHGLALHVRAHQGAVGVVVLEEGDERRRHRDDLLRRDVHVVDLVDRHGVDLASGLAHQRPVVDEGAVGVERGVGLSDDVALFLGGGEVLDLVGDPPVLHLAVRGLDEPEPVDPGVGGQRADQADVRALRRLDRAHPPVVGRVDVAHLEPGPLAAEAAGAEGVEAAAVGQAGQRVGLVHELAQLAGPEELLDGGGDGADVDQALRRDRIRVLGRHPLLDHPLQAAETDADLVLDQLADGADPAVAEVIDVVGVDRDFLARVGDEGLLAGVESHQVADGVDDVLRRAGAGGPRRGSPRARPPGTSG